MRWIGFRSWRLERAHARDYRHDDLVLLNEIVKPED